MNTPQTPTSPLAKIGTDTETLVSNILAVYAQASEQNKVDGANWYPLAFGICNEIAAKNGAAIDKVVAVMAHLSPRLQWSRNVLGTEFMFTGAEMVGFMGASVKNAQRAMDSDAPISTLNGLKVKSFAANILGDEDAVTVDVWAMRVAFGDIPFEDKWLGRKGFYDEIANAYRIAAAKVGISASVMQAVTWIVKRNGRAA